MASTCAVCRQDFEIRSDAITADERTLCKDCQQAMNEPCDHDYYWSKYCGAQVCGRCGDHKGLARCYCGFGLQHGERLEDDIGEATFDGEEWQVDY